MTTVTTETQSIGAARLAASRRQRGGRRLWKRFVTPAVVVVVLLALYLWVSSLPLDSIEQRTLNADYLFLRIGEHLSLTVAASALVAVLAIPVGILLAKTPSRTVKAIVLALANIGQATPAVGVVILLAIIWQTGYTTALVALVIYAFLPVLRNTMIGIEQVDGAIRESARGMGMTPVQVLARIELPSPCP